MRRGLFSMTSGPCTDPDGAARVARAGETASFDSLWGGEHVVLPDPRSGERPLPTAPRGRVDPTFPTKAPGNDKRGRRRPWPRVPDQLTIVRAILAVISGRITREHVFASSRRDGRGHAA